MKRLQIFLKCLKMLLGKHLRRHHDRTLMTIFHAGKQCKHCHDRLTGTDISLHQPVHDNAGCQILPDILPGMLLTVRQFKRQAFRKLCRHVKLLHHIRRFLLMFSLLHLMKCQRKKEKLLKHDPSSCLNIFLLVLRKMNCLNRLLTQNKPVLFAHFKREIISGQICLLQGICHRLADGMIGKPRRQRIDRLQLGKQLVILLLTQKLWLLQTVSAVLIDHPSPHDITRPHMERTQDKRHIKPGHFDLTGAVL